MGEDTPEIRAKFYRQFHWVGFQLQKIWGMLQFLCSEKANMITGVALEVDGGRCI